ncbi:MAG: hypothetical protein A2Y02_03490 [Omnitrophica bacterium GWA2_52_12]|nr:MAG: hypothetical protein A2Y02_03490 [Omnitrophica bacterium GWA2_52_12]
MRKQISAILMIMPVLLSAALPVHAASQTAAQSVTIHVPTSLSLAASQRAIDLTFPENSPGVQTNSLTVSYGVRSNGMSQPDGSSAVSAQLDDVIPGVDFKAAVGVYQKRSGNTELNAFSGSEVVIGSAQTALAAKHNSSGDGRLLDGTLPVTYRAQARQTLEAGTYSRQLFLTLTDV